MGWLLFAATVLQLMWQLHNQVRLSEWLWDEKRLSPPSGNGHWEPVFNGIHRLQQKQRRRRKELANFNSPF